MNWKAQRNRIDTLPGLIHLSGRMPPWLFAVLFFLCAGYLLLTKIESSDLWWHLACGRYLFENNAYPPSGTFTFSPVKPGFTSNAHTWLGDLVLFFIYKFLGKESGLQVFRVVAVCIPVWVFIRLTRSRTNTWTLAGALIIIMGTYQQNLLRNSIFAIFFLPAMVLIWHTSVQKKNFKWLLLYPVILLAWTHMHGYAIVGLYILASFFAGEVVDQCLSKKDRHLLFLGVLLGVLVCSWAIVNVNWHVNPVKILYNIQAGISQKDLQNKTPSIKCVEKTKPEPALFPSLENEHGPPWLTNLKIPATHIEDPHFSKDVHANWITDRFNAGREYAKHLFRPFLKGGDADYVREYKSPFDTYSILPAKTLFVFFLFYMGYLILGVIFDRKGLKVSYVLPSLASIFLGLGYVRTLAFPFEIAFPLMAAHMPGLLTALNKNRNHFVSFMRHTIPWAAFISYLVIIFNFFPSSLAQFLCFFTTQTNVKAASNICRDHTAFLFTLFCILVLLHLIFAFWLDKKSGNRRYIWVGLTLMAGMVIGWTNYSQAPEGFLTNPVRFLTAFTIVLVICLGTRLLTAACRERMYFRFSGFLLALLPLIFCAQFALAAHYHFKEKTFYILTQIFTREPGIGRNSVFRDTMPDHVLDTYPKEDLLNSYGLGGFFLWKWYGQKKVFIDSRSITYKRDFYEDYRTNYGLTYIDRMGIDKAIFPITNGEVRNHAFMSRNWALIAFDINSALWQRQTPEGLKSTFGVLPVFLGTIEDLNLLPVFEMNALGNFINNTLLYMLFFGRIGDALNWTDQITPLIQRLPDNHQQNIQNKLDLMEMLENHFGRMNHAVLGTACRAMKFGDGSPVSLNMILGNAYQSLNENTSAAKMYLAAANLKPGDLELQKQIGERMFKMKFIDQAIIRYLRVVDLTPEPVEEYISLAYLYTIKKEYDQAEKYLRKMLVKLPDHPKTYENLGLVLAAKGDADGAKAVFKKGLSILPGNQRLMQLLNDLEKKTK